ncbi:MAG TPA: hypothetical protein VE998_09045 [Terriglobales bacterium]|nr:hypothetical protein [Terriglobales bacterium]
MKSFRAALIIGTLGVSCTFAVSSDFRCLRDHPLNVDIPQFSASNLSVLEALLKLGQENKLCFGIETGSGILEARVSTDLRNSSAGAAISAILPNAYRFKVVESNGVIEIRLGTTPVDDVLSTSIPIFQVPKAPMQAVSNALRMQLASTLDPRIHGFAGEYASGDLKDLVGPFSETAKSARQLLNSLTASSTVGASWVALSVSRAHPDRIPWNLWRVIEYDRPVSQYIPLLQSLLGQ